MAGIIAYLLSLYNHDASHRHDHRTAHTLVRRPSCLAGGVEATAWPRIARSRCGPDADPPPRCGLPRHHDCHLAIKAEPTVSLLTPQSRAIGVEVSSMAPHRDAAMRARLAGPPPRCGCPSYVVSSRRRVPGLCRRTPAAPRPSPIRAPTGGLKIAYHTFLRSPYSVMFSH